MDKLQILNAVAAIEDWRSPASNNLEKLWGDRVGYWSIRPNLQYHIMFHFADTDAYNVEIFD